MHRLALLFVALFALSASGCCVADAAIDTASTAAAGNDRYTDLVTQSFAGTIDPSLGLAPVTTENFAAAPPSVQRLVRALLESLHVNRTAWHSVLFQLNEGPDPATMDLKPVAPPAAPADDLLGGN